MSQLRAERPDDARPRSRGPRRGSRGPRRAKRGVGWNEVLHLRRIDGALSLVADEEGEVVGHVMFTANGSTPRDGWSRCRR